MQWVRDHSAAPNARPAAFVSVCLGVLQRDPGVDNALQRIVHQFRTSPGWNPVATKIVAGALLSTRYRWWLRLMMKRIARKAAAIQTPAVIMSTPIGPTCTSSSRPLPGPSAAPLEQVRSSCTIRRIAGKLERPSCAHDVNGVDPQRWSWRSKSRVPPRRLLKIRRAVSSSVPIRGSRTA